MASPAVQEIIFEVHEDEIDGGYTASALGYGIHTQGDTLEELRTMVRDAVDCYFDEETSSPKIIVFTSWETKCWPDPPRQSCRAT